MKRDMELVRDILLAIEEQFIPGNPYLRSFCMKDYDNLVVAEHCKLLYQQGLISKYDPISGGNKILCFDVGNLTASGYDYLELIRNDDIWDNTKKEIEKKKLPKTIEFFAKIAGIITGNIVKELNS